jgi:hypothetical protein
MVLEVSSVERYVLLTPPGVSVTGIEMADGYISWELGRKYRVIGVLVTNDKELEAANKLGHSSIISASSVELLE